MLPGLTDTERYASSRNAGSEQNIPTNSRGERVIQSADFRNGYRNKSRREPEHTINRHNSLVRRTEVGDDLDRRIEVSDPKKKHLTKKEKK